MPALEAGMRGQQHTAMDGWPTASPGGCTTGEQRPGRDTEPSPGGGTSGVQGGRIACVQGGECLQPQLQQSYRANYVAFIAAPRNEKCLERLQDANARVSDASNILFAMKIEGNGEERDLDRLEDHEKALVNLIAPRKSAPAPAKPTA